MGVFVGRESIHIMRSCLPNRAFFVPVSSKMEIVPNSISRIGILQKQ